MSRSEGEQYRGALDQYSHQSTSVVNDPAYYYDPVTRSHQRWDGTEEHPVAQKVEPGMVHSDFTGKKALPVYRAPGVATPRVPAAIKVQPPKWEDPWARAPRYVRNPESDASHVWVAPKLKPRALSLKRVVPGIVDRSWALESGGWVQAHEAGPAAANMLTKAGLLVQKIEALDRPPTGIINPGRSRKLIFTNGKELIETIYSPPARDDTGILMLHDIQGYSIGADKDWQLDPIGVKYSVATMSIEVVVDLKEKTTTITWDINANVSDCKEFASRMELVVDAFVSCCKHRFTYK